MHARSPHGPPGGPRDPGLQPERTTLGWGRTILAFVAVAALGLRWLAHDGPLVLAIVGGAVVTGAALAGTQRARYARAARGIARERLTPNVGGVVALAGASVALAAAAIGVVLLVPG